MNGERYRNIIPLNADKFYAALQRDLVLAAWDQEDLSLHATSLSNCS
jgi:hypothetical protein